jgi:flagellar export protein FliJ
MAELRNRMTHQRERLAQAEEQCRERKAELVEAAQARRTLERLSERREAEHRRREAQQEQQELNEAAIARHRANTETALSGALTAELDDVA